MTEVVLDDRVALFERLAGPEGVVPLALAAEAVGTDRELAVGARLRAEGRPADLVAAAFTQAELRRRAVPRFSRASAMFFTRAGLEQASSEVVAAHRAARLDGLDRVADLCVGIGGDLSALVARARAAAESRRELVAVDWDPVHLRMAERNATLVSERAAGPGVVDVRFVLADVREVDLTGVDAVLIDPARRDGRGRLGARATSPPLAWTLGLTDRVAAVAVKAAPGLDLDLVPAGWEVEFVADGRDLKEAALFSPALATGRRRATVLTATGPDSAPGGFGGSGGPGLESGSGLDSDAGAPGQVAGGILVPQPVAATLVGEPDEPHAPRPVRRPGRFLYDPSPAITRAGLVGLLAQELDAGQIDPRIAFLSADRLRPTPFARALEILADLPFEIRPLAQALAALGATSVDIRRRGLAGDVESLRRRILPPRRSGDIPARPVTVVMTRLADKPWAFVCVDAAGGPAIDASGGPAIDAPGGATAAAVG